MRFGCCTSADRLKAVKDAGFDFAEMQVSALAPEGPMSTFSILRQRVADVGLPVEALNVFIPPDLPVVGNRIDLARLDTYLDTALERMSEIGVRIVVFGSGGARSTPHGFDQRRALDQIAEFLEMLAPKLDRNDVTLAIEPLYKRACDNINTVGEALDMAGRVYQPRIKVLADLFHMAHEDDPLESVSLAGDDLRHVHVPVPPLAGMEPTVWDAPYPGFLSALKSTGYDARISVEDNGSRFRDFGQDAPSVLEYLKENWKT